MQGGPIALHGQAVRHLAPGPVADKGVRIPMRVRVPDQRSFEKALRRFKRECIREGIMADMRKSEFYDKPSVARRRKANRARRRRLRQAAELEGK
jgi:small subunit ribosomal protein S21